MVSYSTFLPGTNFDGVVGTTLSPTRNVPRGAWLELEDGTILNVGDIVQYEGSSFLVTVAHTKSSGTAAPPTNEAMYTIMASAGTSGESAYTWFAYADSEDGTVNFTTDAAEGRKYIGLAANKETPVEGTDPEEYTWALIQGPSGASISVIPSQAGFTYLDGSLNPTSQTINYTATLQGVEGEVVWTTNPNIASGTGEVFQLTAAQMGSHQQVIVIATVEGFSQGIVTTKIADPAADPTGSNIADGIFGQSEWATLQQDPAAIIGPVLAFTNDNVIARRQEKRQLGRNITSLDAQYFGLIPRADELNISISDLEVARAAVVDLLNSYSPPWNDEKNDTTILENYFPDKDFPTNWTIYTITSSTNGAYTRITDSSTGVAGNIWRGQSQAAAITTYSVLWIIKKDTDANRVVRAEIGATGGTVKNGGVNINTVTGDIGGINNLVTADVFDIGQEWVLWATFTSNSNNTSIYSRLYPAFSASISATSPTVSTTGFVDVRSPLLVVGDWKKLGHPMMQGRLAEYRYELNKLIQSISQKDYGADINLNIIDSGDVADPGRNLGRNEIRTELGTADGIKNQGRFATRNRVKWNDEDIENKPQVVYEIALEEYFNYLNATEFDLKWVNANGAGVRTYNQSDASVPGGKFMRIEGAQPGGVEHVINGQFNTDTSSWNATLATLSLNSNRMRITTTTSASGYASQQITLEGARTYDLTYVARNSAGANNLFEIVRLSNGIALYSDSNQRTSTYTTTFSVPAGEGGTYEIRCWTIATNTGRNTDYDEISIVSQGSSAQNWLGFLETGVPYDTTATYEIEFWVRRNSGNGLVYLGLSGVDSSGNVWVGTAGDNNFGAGHWVAATAVAPPLGVWTSYKGYVKGKGPVGTSTQSSSSNPGVMHNNTAYIRPTALLNHPDASGSMDIAYAKITKLSTIDDIADGAVYGRIARTDLHTDGRHRLTIAGSQLRLGDQRNMPTASVMNLRYKWVGGLSYSATGGNATITIDPAVAYIGSQSISYGGGTIGVSGAQGSSVTYYIYIDDPNMTGGAIQPQATTTSLNIYQNDARVWVGTITVVFPSTSGGTGGGSGGTGSGGGGPGTVIP